MIVIISIVISYGLIYSSYYSLSKYSDSPLLGIFLQSPATLINLFFSVIGLVIIFKYKNNIKRKEIMISIILASLIWITVQSSYYYNNWVPNIPYYDPTINALQVFFMSLGFFALNIDTPKFSFLNAKNYNFRSIILGLVLGLVFGLANLAFFIFVYGEQLQIGNIIYGCLRALQPGIMEEVAYRLFFMGSSVLILRKYLTKNIADITSIIMAILFHAIPHAYLIILSNPTSAIITIAVLSILFGLPMTVIAYKRGIETSIIFHWTIDAIRFVLIG